MRDKALNYVTPLYEGVVDKGGHPAIGHMIEVSNRCKSELGKIVGLLHDVVEDGLVTYEDLQSEGFSQDVVDAVRVLCHEKHEHYDKYILRIALSNNKTAIEVKLADLSHNMEISRIPNPTQKDFDRVEKKYRPVYEFLSEVYVSEYGVAESL